MLHCHELNIFFSSSVFVEKPSSLQIMDTPQALQKDKPVMVRSTTALMQEGFDPFFQTLK